MYDLNNQNQLSRIIESLVHPEQDRYRKEIDRQWRVLRGDLRFFVEEEIKRLYPKTYQNFIVSEMNFAAKITDKRAKAYKEEPLRVLANDTESKAYQAQLKEMKALWHWRLFDTYRNYFRYSCLWFSFYENEVGEQVPMLRALRPSQFTRIVNDFGQTELFAVYFGSDIESEVQVRGDQFELLQQDEPEDDDSFYIGLWTDKQHKVVKISSNQGGDYRFEEKPLLDNEDGVNDLGIIPAVFSQEGDERERPAFNPLKDQTITLNSMYSIIMSGVSVQTFGQLILKHPQDQTVPDISQQGIFVYLPLPQVGQDEPETSAEYITPSPNIAESLEVFDKYAMNTLREHGLSGEVSGQNKFTSGLDRLLSQMDTTEIIEENQQSFQLCENHLLKIIKAFNELTGGPRYQSEDMSVIFKKPRPLQSEKELLEIIEKKLSLGLIEKYEALMILDPNMGDEAAQNKIEKINEQKSLRINFGDQQEEDDIKGQD